MLKSYLKTALRNLARNRVYSFINISGLSIGLACAMLIMLYVKDEVSFDRFHDNAEQIYRVVSKRSSNGDSSVELNPYTGYFQGPRFAAGVPEIKSFVRLQSNHRDLKQGENVISQEVFYTDSSFFQVFSFPLIKGHASGVLKDPHAVVISEVVAKREFGSNDVIGRTILMKDGDAFQSYVVTGVAATQPANSSIRFDILMPIQVSKEVEAQGMNWFNSFMNTFVVLNPGADPRRVEKKMQQVFEQDSKQAYEEAKAKYGMNEKITQLLQPFTAMHLSTDLVADNGLVGASNPVFSYILTGIALFILLIACINFINLTVARSVKRAKEIGIRKVIGGDRKQLMMQFLGESFFLSFAAFILALGLVQLALPLFNDLANKKLALSYLADATLIAGYVSLFLITALLAGFYPSIVLSGYNPVQTLYSRFALAGKNYLQKGLVVMQFSLASFLIIATMVIYSQLNYLTNTDLGYDDDNLVIVNKGGMSLQEGNIFRDELLKDKNVREVSLKNGGRWGTIAKINGDQEIGFAFESVDERYLKMLNIPVISGRGFSPDFPADSNNSVLVNEAFVTAAGWKQPLQEVVDFWYDNKKFNVVGVVKDHHYEALNNKIKPQLFRVTSQKSYGKLLIKIQPGTETVALAHIEKVFKKLYPLSPYAYKFQDEVNARNYEAEQKWKQIILFGAALTIFISCIGLFGLSVLAAEKRVKEIGIRKVLGASVQQLVQILSTDFLKLVVLALVLAVPLAWLAANKWLENYPYRTSLNWQLFAAAGVLVILVAFVTISFQAIRAAISNPTKSLRSE